MSAEIATLDATAQAELIRRGEVSPLELVEDAINRIEKLNPELNAVIHPMFDKARKVAISQLPDGGFRGVPFLLKDIFAASEGDPHHFGTRFLRDAGWTASEDSYLARKFRQAGLVFLGRTNVPELGAWTTTESEAYGPARNPWDTTRSTGGSSGGSAAAVASGMVPAAHGNDGGGSIRIPASECGLVGLKPTRGRTSLGPNYGESWEGLAVEGVLTRTVRDTAALLDAISGPMPGDPYYAPHPQRPYALEVGADPGKLRIGVMTSSIAAEVKADCIEVTEAAGRLLAELGHVVEESFPTALTEDITDPVVSLISVSQARDLDYWGELIGRRIGADDVDVDNWAVAELGQNVSATKYLAAVQALHGWSRRVAEWWANGFDLLLTPTIAEPPPPIGELVPNPEMPMAGFMRSGQLVAFTVPFNITGQPAISLPLHQNSAKLPIGVQLVAAFGREDLLIRVASQLEKASPWADRWPPLSA